jgi:hypothetical protein
MIGDLLIFNGVNGATGEYGLPPMTAAELAGFPARRGEARKPGRTLLARDARREAEEAFPGHPLLTAAPAGSGGQL